MRYYYILMLNKLQSLCMLIAMLLCKLANKLIASKNAKIGKAITDAQKKRDSKMTAARERCVTAAEIVLELQRSVTIIDKEAEAEYNNTITKLQTL